MSHRIRKEIILAASPQKVYEALMDSNQFSKVTGAPAEINTEVGGSFSCFGGMISGRNVELEKGQRIVQAWRAGNWDPGIYSIVKFELKSMGANTSVALEHVGFPEGQEDHLTEGWQTRYLEPLKSYLAP